jgi:hypothetical protein
MLRNPEPLEQNRKLFNAFIFHHKPDKISSQHNIKQLHSDSCFFYQLRYKKCTKIKTFLSSNSMNSKFSTDNSCVALRISIETNNSL